MSRPGTLVTASVLAIALQIASAPVLAQDRCPPAEWSRAVALSQEAKALLEKKKHADALRKLHAAYGICPEPKLLRAIGRVYHDAGRPEEAIAAFRSCVKEGAEEAVRAECEQQIKAIEDRILTATILVEAVPPSAEVFVDGAGRPQAAGVPIRVKPGRHEVELRAPGKSPHKTAVEAVEGRETRVRVAMEAPPAPADARAAASGPLPEPPADTPTLAAAPAFAPETKWNWVGIGAGAAVTGLGVAFLVQYGWDKRDANGPERNDPQRPDLVTREADSVGPRNLALGVTFSVLGVAGVVVSAVLWPKTPVSAAAAPVPGGGGAVALAIGL
jgi:hypothetical protein